MVVSAPCTWRLLPLSVVERLPSGMCHAHGMWAVEVCAGLMAFVRVEETLLRLKRINLRQGGHENSLMMSTPLYPVAMHLVWEATSTAPTRHVANQTVTCNVLIDYASMVRAVPVSLTPVVSHVTPAPAKCAAPVSKRGFWIMAYSARDARPVGDGLALLARAAPENVGARNMQHGHQARGVASAATGVQAHPATGEGRASD